MLSSLSLSSLTEWICEDYGNNDDDENYNDGVDYDKLQSGKLWSQRVVQTFPSSTQHQCKLQFTINYTAPHTHYTEPHTAMHCITSLHFTAHYTVLKQTLHLQQNTPLPHIALHTAKCTMCTMQITQFQLLHTALYYALKRLCINLSFIFKYL